MTATAVSVLAWSLHVPGARAGGLPAAVAEVVGPEPACPPEQAQHLLGRKGLLNLEPATRLALCAVHRALGLPAGARPATGSPDPRTAVVASSNLGNAGTVVDLVRSVRSGGIRAVSPLSVANASSNVLASAVGRWFGFGGANLMICSGATAGLDAIAAAALLLRAGRADRVVVVGAEPADEVAVAMHTSRSVASRPLMAGASCVVLGRRSGGPPVPSLGPVEPVVDPVVEPVAGAGIRLGPPESGATLDPFAGGGDLYGAGGVAYVAVAAGLTTARAEPVTVVCGDRADGWRTVRLSPPGVRSPARGDGA